MAFKRNINDFILTVVALSLPSIAAIDCNGKPFHCLNSTHFMICVDFGSGVSSTMDDFIIPCPPTMVCQATNRFECEFPKVTTTTVTSFVTNSPLAATVNNDVVVIDAVSDVTTIPFEEYFNTISTTTVSEGNLITRDAVTTELPVNNPSESFNVSATDSSINETAINVGVSPIPFTTLATLNIVTDETTVTERIPHVDENVKVIFEPNSNISEDLPTATEMVLTDIDNNTVDVTENYESNSTLLETIIGATNFRQFNTPTYNSTSYNVTEPIVSQATESMISIPVDDKQVYLTRLDASPDFFLDNRTIENVTESIPTKPTEYKDLIQHQKNSTLNETMSTGDIVQNDPTKLNTALDINGFALNMNHSGLSFYEITTKYTEQLSTTEPTLFEVKENRVNIPVDEQVYLPTLDVSPAVFLDAVTESIPAETTEYKHLIDSETNSTLYKTISSGDIVQNDTAKLNTLLNTYESAFNVNNSDSYFNEITTKYEEQISTAEPYLNEAKENEFDEKQTFLTTLDESRDVFLNNKTKDTVTESIPTETTEYKRLIESQSNLFNNKLIDNSTYYDIAEPILSDVTEGIISTPVDNKEPYLSTLNASLDVVLGDQTVDNVTETVLTETTDYKQLKEPQSNSILNKTMSDGDFVQNDSTIQNTVLKTNKSTINVKNSNSHLSEMTTKYEEQVSTAEPILYQAEENTINIFVDDKQAYLTTLDASPDVFLVDQTIDTATESILAETTEYQHFIDSESNPTLYETISGGDIVHNDTTKLNTVLNTYGSAFNVNHSDSSFNKITTKYEEQITATEPIFNEAKENELQDKPVFLTTIDESPDVFLDNKTIDTVTESIKTETTAYRYSTESESNSTLNATMSSSDIEQSYTTTANTILNINGSVTNVQNSYLSLNEDTTSNYEEEISTLQNNFELSGNTGTEITQLDVTEMANITKLKLSVTTIGTTTINTKPISTNTLNASIYTDAAGEVTVKLNMIESGNKTNIFDDMQATELSFKDSNYYLNSTEDSIASALDNRSVKPENNTNTMHSENLTTVNYVENVTRKEMETEEIHLKLPKPPTSNEIYGDNSSADNTTITYIIRNIDTIIAQNKTTSDDNYSVRADEAQRVFTSENNVNDKTADYTEYNHLFVTEPTSTSFSNDVHILGSDLTNKNLQLTQNVIGSDMINSTEITETPSKHIELSNRKNNSTVDDQINTVEISESTPNNILETTTQEVDSFSYSNLYYQTDIEEIIHDQGVLRNNILSGDTIESTSSIYVLTTESTNEPHFDAALQATTLSYSVGNQMYTEESDNYRTSTTNSPQPEATASTAFDSINSAADTSKLVTRENEVEEISTASSILEITSAVATKQNIPTTDITNSPQQTAITSSTAFGHRNSAVNQVEQVTRPVEDDKISTEPSMLLQVTRPVEDDKISTEPSMLPQVTRQVKDDEISTEPSMLPISFTINKTAYVASEQNIPSAEVTPEPTHLIPDRFKYTITTETTNDSVHQDSRIEIASDSSTTKTSESSALSVQFNREIKNTLLATTTSNTATDLSAISNLTVSNLSNAGVTNFREEINSITVVDSHTTETTIDAISKASTDNVLENYPITFKQEDINLENIRNPIKINTTTEDHTVTEDTKNTEPLRSYSIQRENISKFEITSIVTDQTTLSSFVADDVKLSDTKDRVLNAQAEPNITEILPERSGTNVNDPNSSVNKATVIDGLTLMNTAVAADTKLTRDEINQQSTKKSVIPKISTTEMLLNETLKENEVMPVMTELKTNLESIAITPRSNGDINTNPNPITTETSSFESHTERKWSLTTSIQESKYQSNLASNMESGRATVVTEPVVHPTRPYTEILITSSKPYTKSNDDMSEDITSLTPKLNLANPSEKQYINLSQNIEPATKNVLTSLEPSVIFPQATEPNSLANQDVESSSVRKYTTQKSYGIDTLKLVQNQGVSSTENHFISVTPVASSSTITKLVDLSTRQSFTGPNTQTLPEQNVFKNGDQIEVPTTEKIKVNVIPIISSSVKDEKPLVDATAAPILKSSNNISKAFMTNDKILTTAVYNSNRTVETVPTTEFNKVQLNITNTTEKTMTRSSDLDIVMVDIVMVDIVNTVLPNLGDIGTGNNNTHSGISATQKSTPQQAEKHKTIKSVAENVQKTKKEEKFETEKEEKPEVDKKEKPEVAETNPLNGKIEPIMSTESIPINKQANLQYNPPLNIKPKPDQNATTRTIPVDSYVENTTAGYSNNFTITKSSVANIHNSTHPTSVTSKHNFVCKSNNRGRFSDNGDCRKFYICIGKHEPIKGICPNNTVFSELRKQCTKNLSHCVRNNQFQCVSEGRFSDYLNDNIYYICVINKANRFIRFKLQCQNGYYLNQTSVRCVMNTELTESILATSQQSQQSKSASDVSTSYQSISAKSEKLQEKPKTNKKFVCKKSGKFPEPNDCRKYYVCTKLGKSEYQQRSKKCDSDEVYNRDKKKCVDADSYECS